MVNLPDSGWRSLEPTSTTQHDERPKREGMHEHSDPGRVQAYAVLSDPDTRAEYNALLEQALADEDDSFTGACQCSLT